MLPFCAGQKENLENAHLHTDATEQTGDQYAGGVEMEEGMTLLSVQSLI